MLVLFVALKRRTDRFNPGHHLTRGNSASYYTRIGSFEFPILVRVVRSQRGRV
jgi:hypothetical protein